MVANSHPHVHGIFDPATWTITYVVYAQEGSACAIIDPVLDYDPKSGRTRTETADKLIKFVEEKKLQVELLHWQERNLNTQRKQKLSNILLERK